MKLELVKKVKEAKDTKSFFWKPKDAIDFKPGQYYYYTLSKLSYPDDRGPTRHFTIANSPTESGLIFFTTRIRDESGYKKTLDELPIGSVIDGEGPQGTFIFDSSYKNNVFLAGGIGITPFRCFIKYNIDLKLNIPVHLIFSNSGSEFVYKKELDLWQKNHNFLKIDYFDSIKEGHLDGLKIKKTMKKDVFNIIDSTPWLVGPPAFVSGVEDVLEQMGVKFDRILTEKFTGY